VREDFTGDYAHDAEASFLGTTMAARHEQHVLQNDLSFTLGGTRIELGQKLQLRGIRADYDARRDGVIAAHEFRYDDRVLAGYASLQRGVGPLHVELGVRAEQDRTTVEWEEATTHSQLRAFPSLLLHWPQRGSGAWQYRLAYGRRINRPDASALNPYSMGEDDMNEIVGNPALRPEIADQFEFGVERSSTTLTLQLTPFVRITRDPIRPLKTVTESGRATTTLESLSRTQAYGLDGTARTRLGGHTTVMFSASVFNMETAGAAYRNEGVYATARANIDVRVTDRTTLQLYAWRRSAQAIEQGEILPTSSTELALTQAIGAADRGRVTLRVADPFESDRLAFRIGDATFTQQSSRRVPRPVATLFVSWAVGGTPRESDRVSTEQPARIF
jgi:hypothetical protein